MNMSNHRVLLLLVTIALYPVHAICEPAPRLVAAARSQIGTTLYYDSSYRILTYPNGDVPPDRGVCTDVVIRALRKSTGIDLQQRVHEDMARYFSLYPSSWGLKH